MRKKLNTISIFNDSESMVRHAFGKDNLTFCNAILEIRSDEIRSDGNNATFRIENDKRVRSTGNMF